MNILILLLCNMIEKIQLVLLSLLIILIIASTVYIDSQYRLLINEIKNVKNVILSSNEINDAGAEARGTQSPGPDLKTSIDQIKTIMNSFKPINEDEVEPNQHEEEISEDNTSKDNS